MVVTVSKRGGGRCVRFCLAQDIRDRHGLPAQCRLPVSHSDPADLDAERMPITALLNFEMCCGRGTYVRSLIRDLAEKLSTGGCLRCLSRTSVGPFAESSAWSIETLQGASGPEDYLVDLDRYKRLLDPGAIRIPARPDKSCPVRPVQPRC